MLYEKRKLLAAYLDQIVLECSGLSIIGLSCIDDRRVSSRRHSTDIKAPTKRGELSSPVTWLSYLLIKLIWYIDSKLTRDDIIIDRLCPHIKKNTFRWPQFISKMDLWKYCIHIWLLHIWCDFPVSIPPFWNKCELISQNNKILATVFIQFTDNIAVQWAVHSSIQCKCSSSRLEPVELMLSWPWEYLKNMHYPTDLILLCFNVAFLKGSHNTTRCTSSYHVFMMFLFLTIFTCWFAGTCSVVVSGLWAFVCLG